MATLEEGEPLPNEVIDTNGNPLDGSSSTTQSKAEKKREEAEKIRDVVANVYTFVRSQEINRVIGAFTFDHYVDEAKRRLKGSGREIRDAAGKVIKDDKTGDPMLRPSLLDYLTKLKADFAASYNSIVKMAEAADKAAK